MPATSKAQWRYMEAIAHGMTPRGHGPTRAQAREFVAGQNPKGLSARARKRRKPRR